MKSCFLNGILIVVPIAVISFCCWFFFSVFDRTISQGDLAVPVVQISISDECSSNAVLRVLSEDIVGKKFEAALTERERIAEREHTKFRGELGAWLSVFGLLTILVTLITPICSLVFQQREFDRLQKLIDNQSKSIKEIKDQQAKIEDQQAKIEDQQSKIVTQQDEIRTKQNEVSQAAEKVSNDIVSNDANIVENTQLVRQDGLRSILNYFKSIWGKDRTDEKISVGIRLFDECNAKISEAITRADYDSLKNCLNILNNANAYLGSRNLETFRNEFSQRMHNIRPLKHSNEEVVKFLEEGGLSGPIIGFYKSSLNLQGDVPG